MISLKYVIIITVHCVWRCVCIDSCPEGSLQDVLSSGQQQCILHAVWPSSGRHKVWPLHLGHLCPEQVSSKGLFTIVDIHLFVPSVLCLTSLPWICTLKNVDNFPDWKNNSSSLPVHCMALNDKTLVIFHMRLTFV